MFSSAEKFDEWFNVSDKDSEAEVVSQLHKARGPPGAEAGQAGRTARKDAAARTPCGQSDACTGCLPVALRACGASPGRALLRTGLRMGAGRL